MKKVLLFVAIFVAFYNLHAQNWGFESWSATNVLTPDDYFSSINDWGVLADSTVQQSSDSYMNTYSIHLKTIETSFGDTIFGYFMNGDPETMEGGHPVSITTMDSIVGYYKYDIPAGDTALLICTPKYMGTPSGGGMFKIFGTQTTWTRFAYPISAVACDSVVIAAASSNAFYWQGIPGSYIMFDDIRYVSNASGTEPAMNGDFENWTNIGWDEPDEWTTSNAWALGSTPLPVEQTTDIHSGTFAAQLTTAQHPVYGDTINGMLTNGNWSHNGAVGGMAYTGSPTGIEFYYKYNPFGTDTAWFTAIFKNNGAYLDMFGTQIFSASTYTLWSMPITLSGTPDTLLIAIGSGNNPGSQLLIDDINFTFPVGTGEGFTVNQLIAYPVPAQDVINFKFDLENDMNVCIQIINTAGTVVSENNFSKSAGSHRTSIDVSGLPTGNYLYKVTIGQRSFTKSFIKN